MPPAAAGPAPQLSLAYSSGSVDGQNATTNNQGSSVGEGLALSESYIERTYGSCDQDGHDGVHDECWKYDNARLVLNGASSRLVKDGTTGKWRLENDDASTVTRSAGADNGDDNGEYWTVTTGDGTKYVFGRPWAMTGAGRRTAHRVTTVPRHCPVRPGCGHPLRPLHVREPTSGCERDWMRQQRQAVHGRIRS